MQRPVINFAEATRVTGVYRANVSYIEAVTEDDSDCQRSLWDKLLGITTMVVVSAGGWAVVIELIRLLR